MKRQIKLVGGCTSRPQLSPAGYKQVKETERNERRHEMREKLNGWREAYKCAFF